MGESAIGVGSSNSAALESLADELGALFESAKESLKIIEFFDKHIATANTIQKKYLLQQLGMPIQFPFKRYILYFSILFRKLIRSKGVYYTEKPLH
tara:strand:- start:457 stop:744 length:288 start_codon:yes stop_codon:yes gene_type:complete